MMENQTQQSITSIRVISSIKKKERKTGFIKQDKLFFPLWLLWMLINLALWACSYAYLNPYYNIGDVWDLPEVIICGADPLLLFILYRITERVVEEAQKKKRTPRSKRGKILAITTRVKNHNGA